MDFPRKLCLRAALGIQFLRDLPQRIEEPRGEAELQGLLLLTALLIQDHGLQSI